MDVSIVVSTYNRCRLLEEALRALLSQTSADVAYEILVVDNNSTDQTRPLVEGLAKQNPEKLKYLFEPKQGLSYGRNTGIAAAKAPIIAFTDDDVRVAPDWVWRIKTGFEANPDIDFLGGRVVGDSIYPSSLPPLKSNLTGWRSNITGNGTPATGVSTPRCTRRRWNDQRWASYLECPPISIDKL